MSANDPQRTLVQPNGTRLDGISHAVGFAATLAGLDDMNGRSFDATLAGLDDRSFAGRVSRVQRDKYGQHIGVEPETGG
jgi:hypothetical protein